MAENLPPDDRDVRPLDSVSRPSAATESMPTNGRNRSIAAIGLSVSNLRLQIAVYFYIRCCLVKMFRTYPEAEISLPALLASDGERSWHWVELALQCPFFLVTVSQQTEEEGSIVRRILVSRIADVIEFVRNGSDCFLVTRVDLMSPGYLRGEDGYSLNRIVEVWRDKTGQRHYSYKLADGTWLDDIFDGDNLGKTDPELIMSL